MAQFNVIARIRVPNPVAQVWNGNSYQTDTRVQEIRTLITANNFFEAKAMIEGQYGSSLVGQPIITESR